LVIYSVSVIIKREFEEEWFDWMLHIHIQNVLRRVSLADIKFIKQSFHQQRGITKHMLFNTNAKALMTILHIKKISPPLCRENMQKNSQAKLQPQEL